VGQAPGLELLLVLLVVRLGRTLLDVGSGDGLAELRDERPLADDAVLVLDRERVEGLGTADGLHGLLAHALQVLVGDRHVAPLELLLDELVVHAQAQEPGHEAAVVRALARTPEGGLELLLHAGPVGLVGLHGVELGLERGPGDLRPLHRGGDLVGGRGAGGGAEGERHDRRQEGGAEAR
jgi:hypothetical protein